MLKNKNALVIGATSDFGESITRLFAANGVARMILSGRNTQHLSKISDNLKNCTVETIQCDLSRSGSVAAFMQSLESMLGSSKVDIFVYCPGTCGDMDPITYLRLEEDFMNVWNINFYCCVEIFEGIVDRMSEQGSAIFISSTNSFEPMECGSAYCTTKAALKEYMENKAVQLGKRNVRVNNVSPGMVETKFHDAYFESKEEEREFFEGLANNTPLGRLATVRGVSNSVLFLASDLSCDITGTEIVIDCGASLSHPLNEVNEEEEEYNS